MARTTEKAVIGPTEKWAGKLQSNRAGYLNRTRSLRRQIMIVEGMDPLDRAVLGMTGSEEELERYRTLAKKVGEQAGQPLIVISEVRVPRGSERKKITKAEAGIIVNDLEVKLEGREPYSRPADPLEYRAELRVPVVPILSYAWHDPYVSRQEENNFYFNEDTTGQPDWGGFVTVADFSHYEFGNNTLEPDNDVRNTVAIDNVLVGREAIYTHPLFANGISKILLALEEEAARDVYRNGPVQT